MSDYVVLNLEDKIADIQVGAAATSINALKKRYEDLKKPGVIARRFVGVHHVNEHRCVTSKPTVGFTTDGTLLSSIRAACAGAKKIYVMAHGDPRTPDVCHTNNVGSTSGVLQLATAKQLAAFLAPLLNSGTSTYHVALVMCYGARCRDYKSSQVNHVGMIGQTHLTTSFAYKLFHSLSSDHGVKLTMSAVIGKIQHDSSTGRALVEREDLIDVNMEIAEADREKRDSMKAAVGGTLLPQDQQDALYKQNFDAWKISPEGARTLKAAGDARAAKQIVLGSGGVGGRAEELPKYGKLVYRLKGAKLSIISKYGAVAGGGVKPGTVLYSGPILAPS